MIIEDTERGYRKLFTSWRDRLAVAGTERLTVVDKTIVEINSPEDARID